MDFLQEIVLENAQCRMEFHLPERAASACSATLRDKATGLTLRGGLCEAEVLWNALQRSEIQKDLELLSAEKRGSEQAVFRFAAGRARTRFEMCVTLQDREFTVRFPWNAIAEPRVTLFRLFGLRPLPKLLTARPTDTYVAPIRSGVLIVPSKHHVALKDNFLLYGQQWRWEDLPLIPTCGLYAQGQDGIQLIAEEGDCDTQYEIELDGQGAGACGFSCRYRYTWVDPVDPIDRVIRYVLLDRAAADYTGMGLRLNRFARETWKMATLEEKCRRSPELRYASQAMTSKTFHGMKELDHENGDGPFHLYQTFAETCRQLRKIKDAGVERLYVQLVGWNIDGHDGQYPIRFPIEPRAGGEQGFRELLRYGQSLGYQMQVHDNYADVYQQPDYPALVRLLDGQALSRGIWGGGAAYGINPMKLGADLVKRDMLKLRDMGVKGLYYMDAMSAPLEVDYDPKQGGPRRFHADGLGWVIERGREVFGSAGTECGFAHIVRHSDFIGNTPLRNLYAGHVSSSPIQALIDECVPLWHFMFHGMVIHCTADESFPCTAKLLEAAETGGSARSDFTGETPDPSGPLFAMQWDDRLLPAFKAKHDILVERLGPNQCAFIRKHARIGANAFETTFSNGCAVQVDYAEKRLRVDGKDVAIPPVFDLDIGVRR